MAFHFTLATVLRYRRSLEEREELRLQTLLLRRSKILHELAGTRERGVQMQSALLTALEQGLLPAIEIHFSGARLSGLEHEQQRLHSQLAELQDEISAQTARLRQQRRNREVLETLRDQQCRDYKVQQLRREQALLDELHLLRRPRRQA